MNTPSHVILIHIGIAFFLYKKFIFIFAAIEVASLSFQTPNTLSRVGNKQLKFYSPVEFISTLFQRDHTCQVIITDFGMPKVTFTPPLMLIVLLELIPSVAPLFQTFFKIYEILKYGMRYLWAA